TASAVIVRNTISIIDCFGTMRLVTGKTIRMGHFLSMGSMTIRINNYRAEFQCFYSLSWFYVNKKDYKTALIFLDSAEQLLTRKNNIYYISTIYDLRGRIAYSRRNFDKALQLYLKTISNGSLYNSNWVVATNLFNISAIYNRLGNIEFGEKYSEMALEIFKNSENKEFASVILEVNAKFAYTRANAADKKDPDYRANLKKTIEYACRAIRLKEEIRQTSDDESKKKYLDSEFGIYQMMISCYKGLGNKSAEFEAIEISKTKWLEERICKDLQFNQNISLAESQKMATGNTLFISYAKRIESYYYSSVIDESDYFSTKISKRKFVFDSLIFLSGFSSYLHNSLPENKYKKYVDHEYKSKNGKLMKEIYYLFISYYRELIQRSSFTPQQRIDFAMASNALYRFLLGPFEEQLKGKNKLIIIPDGLLGFIPFESLINNDGQYLVEIFDIQYIQSLSVLKLLNERKYEKREKGLIAFGGAEYSEEKFGRFEDNSVNRSCKQLKGLSNSDIYSKLGFNSFNNIPESCNEIERIADEFSKKKIYSGKKVTESLVKELSENNSLIDYSVIHFSTHGIFIPEYPNLSAIVLPAGDKSEDGFLNAKEIAKLNIQADFVNLSACETGLGKIYEGEGVVGIAQSFVIAGANAMSVSLWQVADRSTSIFMTELYKMVREDNISYSMAMNRIKRKFINGDYHKAQILPYYWAPFIYYGK
ncbi:MAG: CHAT domain-containing tetratricopeptide repeat protein, partial [Bacteroidota bacterium]|nr:CHAT domain-containing tetratricopeptide repeat protein [Bacteroidota bacterium]